VKELHKGDLLFAGLVKDTTRVDSSLNKKYSVITYHFVRWNITARVISIAWTSGELNIADAMPKRLPEIKRDKLVGDWTY
jgi:hypothetical protein